MTIFDCMEDSYPVDFYKEFLSDERFSYISKFFVFAATEANIGKRNNGFVCSEGQIYIEEFELDSVVDYVKEVLSKNKESFDY